MVKEELNLDELNKVYGRVFSAVLPSGDTIAIREQNGEDDDILSNLADVKKLESANNFLSGVIVFHSRYGKIFTPEMVKKMPIRDKYISLLLTRIFSFGDTLSFKWTWEGDSEPIEYTEDLNIYLWDYSKPTPNKGDKDFNTSMIRGYESDPYEFIELTTKSGKKLRLKYLTGEAEMYLLNLNDNDRSRNKEFLARGLEMFIEDKWQLVSNFKSFSPIDMKDIRKALLVDLPFALTTWIEHPLNKIKEEIDITSLEDFFFPSDF